MSLPLITPGVAVRESAPLNLSFHVRANHVSTLSENPKPYDIGFVQTWVQTHKEENKGFALSLLKPGPDGNERVTNSKIYSYKIPTPPNTPQLVGDYTNEVELGKGGLPFQLKISDRICGETGIIGFGYTSGPQLRVIDIPQKAEGGYIYTVEIFNNDTYEYVESQYLKHGTKVFRITSLRGLNSGGQYDDAAFLNGPGLREMQGYISDGFANLSYSFDEESLLAIPSNQVVEFWRLTDGKGIAGNTLRWQDIWAKLGPDGVKRALASGNLQMSWMTLVEAQAMKKLTHDLATQDMWGQGGLAKDANGKSDLRLHAGLWHQFKRGPEYVYDFDTFTLKMFENEIRNYFRGKVDFADPNPKITLIVRIGEGLYHLINEAITAKAFSKGMQIDASKIGAITGENRMELQYGFGFTSYIIPNLATLKFVIDPALDPEQDSDIDNPRLHTGYRLSSYTALVYDYNEQAPSDNIITLKYGGPRADAAYANMVRMRVNQGTLPWGGIDALRDRVPFVSSSDDNGFAVKVDVRHRTQIVLDPTRIMRWVMRNPITGKTI